MGTGDEMIPGKKRKKLPCGTDPGQRTNCRPCLSWEHQTIREDGESVILTGEGAGENNR